MPSNTSIAALFHAPAVECVIAPAAVRYASSREELRHALLPDLFAGCARWISMDGLDINHTQCHGRLLRTIASYRPGPSGAIIVPHTAILDWSTTRSTTVAALAQFAVLVPWLTDRGAVVVCVEPSDPNVARCLEQGALEHVLGFRWVDSHPALEGSLIRGRPASISRASANFSFGTRHTGPVDLLASPLVLDLRNDAGTQRLNSEQAGAASTLLQQSGVSRGLDETVCDTFGALFLEIVANARQHSTGNWTSVVFGISHTPEPRLEFAVADDGMGIAVSMLRHFPLWEVQRIPERALLTALFTDPEAGDRPGIVGRGGTLLMRALVSQTPGAEIIIRSGGASLHVRENLVQAGIASCASHGLGTVVSCSVPLPFRA